MTRPWRRPHRLGRRRHGAGSELRRTSLTIGLQAAGLLLAVLVLFAGLVTLMVVRSQQQEVTSVLTQAIAITHGDGGRRPDGDDSQLRSVSVAVDDPSGFRIDGTMPAGLPDRSVMARVRGSGVVDQRTVTLGGRHYEVRTDRHGDDTIQAVYNLAEQRAELARLMQAMLLAGLTGIALVAAVSALLTRRAVRPMADALAMQRRFVSDAAHELRTPLTLLSTRAQLLRRRAHHSGAAAGADPDQPADPAARADTADLDGLVADTQNLTAILEELLLATDLRSAPPEEVDLVGVVETAVAAARASAGAGGIRIDLVLGDAPEPSGLVRGSRAALLRAVTALLDNATGHARTHVQVGVRVTTPGSSGRRGRQPRLAVVVRDDGPGIAPDLLPGLFDRFASHRDATATGRRHYGLGLSLVSEIASRCGGSVRASNRSDGTGAEFILDLPSVAANSSPFAVRPDPRAGSPSGRGPRLSRG